VKKGWKLTIVRIIAFVFVLGITAVLFYYRDQVGKFEGLGYPGIFLISLLSNATIILPVPGILVTSAMGTIFNPFWVAIAAGSGSSVGEISGYLLGFSGQGVIENKKWYDRICNWMRKYGDITVFLLALIPNPLFDIAGMVAGALRLPVWRFLVWTWLGKTIKMMAFAYGGASIMGLFT
jgi:membrane protein YqaA with SNARE-associated domain